MKTPVFATLTIVSAAAIGLVSLRGMTTSRTPQKPIQSEFANTYFKAPPPSLDGMIADADLVIVGRVLNANGRYEPNGIHVLTAHRVRIDELLYIKSGLTPPGDELTFVRNGGDIDLGTHVKRVIEDGFPPVEPGHQYVLFLFWNRALDAWKPAFGPDSVLDVSSGKVLSPGKATITDSLRGKDGTAVIEALRQAASR
jgi:hypothetical protein